MNKVLIEMQRGCKATCVVILESDISKLGPGFIMDAKTDNNYLYKRPLGNPIFKEKIDSIKDNKLIYFVIRGISELDNETQNRYIGLVKDREFGGYNLPDNVIIVFTIKAKEDLNKISNELYHFCVVAI